MLNRSISRWMYQTAFFKSFSLGVLSLLLSDLMKVHDKEAREYYAVGDLRKARDNERIYGSIQARRTRFDAETLRIMKE